MAAGHVGLFHVSPAPSQPALDAQSERIPTTRLLERWCRRYVPRRACAPRGRQRARRVCRAAAPHAARRRPPPTVDTPTPPHPPPLFLTHPTARALPLTYT